MSEHYPALAAGGLATPVTVSGSNLTLVVIVAVIALSALAVAGWLVREVLAASQGTAKMQEIAKAVQEGAAAYLRRQFRTLGVFVFLIFWILLLLPADSSEVRWGRSIFFLVGALFSGLTGFTGMSLCVRGNVRVAAAARDGRRAQRDADRVPHRRRGRHVHGGPGPVRRGHRGADLQGQRAGRTGGLRVRRGAARHVHEGRRRHLHQGRRRGRGPGRQGRAGHPRGRPAERGHDRRQRRRQRGRLRRHGGGPLRVLRGHAGRLADPGQVRLWRQGTDLPAARPDDRRDHGGDRHLRGRATRARPQRDDRDQPRLLHLRGDFGYRGRDSLLHLPAGEVQRAVGHRQPRDRRLQRQSAVDRVRRGADRHRAGVRDPAADRVLHRDQPAAGQGHRARPRRRARPP